MGRVRLQRCHGASGLEDTPRVRSCRVSRVAGQPCLAALAEAWSDADHLVLLDSADRQRGRWSILGVDPSWVFRAADGVCTGGPPGAEVPLEGAPFDVLAQRIAQTRLVAEDLDAAFASLPFRGGALGYLAYELLHQLEAVPVRGEARGPVPDAYLIFCDVAVVQDAVTAQTFLVANGFGGTSGAARGASGRRLSDLAQRLDRISVPDVAHAPPAPLPARRIREADLTARGVASMLPHQRYVAVVARAQEHIRRGDVFEICTCNRFETTFTGSGIGLYRSLRAVSPAPFAAYLRLPGVEVMSSSPERFLRLDRDGIVASSPIKGTRPRGATPEADEALRRQLTDSEKDRAENVMIVDLVRSDLGRVCEIGSITVPELQQVHTFAFTHQMISTVCGRIRPDVGPVDVIRAAFPGGSMTGAPKIEAMTIIGALEPVARGVYSGAIGYIDFEGAFDLSIVIRTFVRSGETLSFHVGGAVVSDSDPEEEHQETLDKAAGMLAALERLDPAGEASAVSPTGPGAPGGAAAVAGHATGGDPGGDAFVPGAGAPRSEPWGDRGSLRSVGHGVGGSARVVILDNYDSFTYNLHQQIGQILGTAPVVLRNDRVSLDEIVDLSPTHLVISPGPGTPEDPEAVGIGRQLVATLGSEIPILGVCLGHQGIAHAYGARIVAAPEPVHGKVRAVTHDGTGVFRGLPSPLDVMRYHSLVVDPATLPSDLRVTAWGRQGLIMGIAHVRHPVFGVQFHPESIGTPQGRHLVENFLALQA